MLKIKFPVMDVCYNVISDDLGRKIRQGYRYILWVAYFLRMFAPANYSSKISVVMT